MVYGGKASRGCRTCLKRRIKCDGGRPTCACCSKSKRDCLGYRFESDMIFHDQTEATIRRVKLLHAVPNGASYDSLPETLPSVSPKQSQSWTPERPSSSSRVIHFSKDAVTCFSLGPPDYLNTLSLGQEPEQLAIGFFFNRFIFVPRHSEAAHGFLEALPHLYTSAGPQSALAAATMAISLAAFANTPAKKVFLPQTRLMYGEAMIRIHREMEDPLAVRKDETLMTVLLLGLLEVGRAGFGNLKPCPYTSALDQLAYASVLTGHYRYFEILATIRPSYGGCSCFDQTARR